MTLALIWYFALTFAFGAVCLMVSGYLYLRNRTVAVRNYFFFMALQLVNFNFSFLYLFSNLLYGQCSLAIDLAFAGIQGIGQVATWYVIPLFFLSLIGKPLIPLLRNIIVGLMATGLFWIFGILSIPVSDAARFEIFQITLVVLSLVKFVPILLLFIYYYPRRHNVWGYESRLAVRTMLGSILVAPVIFLGDFFLRFRFETRGIRVGVMHLCLFVFVWSLLSVIVASRYFLTHREIRSATDALADFAKCHGLSERETEIAGFLVAGAGNQEIADRLFLALPTVKTHVQNLYKKTGVNSRMKLLVLLGK